MSSSASSTGSTTSSSGAREQTINGRPIQSPLQVAQFTESIIKKHLGDALLPEDRETLQRANSKLMVHATTGLFVGSTFGCALAFRRRWMSGFRAVQAARNGTTAPATPPTKTFYSSAGEKPSPQGETVKASRVAFLAKGLGLGMLGALVGTQVGVWTGTRSAQRVVQNSGHEKRIAQSLNDAMTGAMKEIEANSTGLQVSHALLRKTKEQSHVSAYGDDAPPDTDPEAPARTDSFTPEENLSRPHAAPPSSSEGSTRWDELRAAQGTATPSSWDTIRESSARGSMPRTGSTSRTAAGAGGGAPTSSSSSVDSSKDEQRRRFEEMMDRERRGGEESFGDDSKWK